MGVFLGYLRELFDIPAIIVNLYKHRNLIKILAWRDFQARFRGSFGGLGWGLLQPLLMMVIYTLVFSTFLQVRFGNDDSPLTFAVFLLCGLLPWTTFSDSFLSMTNIVRSNSNLVKRTVFPLEILPLNYVFTATIQQLIGFILLLPLSVLVAGKITWMLAFIPLILLFQTLFLTGVCWIWSSLATYIPDLKQISNLIVTALMFMTPLFYPRDVLPDWAAPIADLNPLAQIIEMYRKAFLTGAVIPGKDLLITGGVSLGLFMLGYFWFIHTKKGFSDIL